MNNTYKYLESSHTMNNRNKQGNLALYTPCYPQPHATMQICVTNVSIHICIHTHNYKLRGSKPRKYVIR